MNNLRPPSKSILFIILTAFLCVAFIIGFSCAKLTSYKFYDGEGNTIPYYAVDSLVHSRYVDLSQAGRDTVQHYFPY